MLVSRDTVREAICKGERKIDNLYIYTCKIDGDVKLNDTELTYWNLTREAIIESLGWMIIDVLTNDTTRGFHTVINLLSQNELSEREQNFLQFLLGDDIVRYKINKARIEKGIDWSTANILFSRILKRFPSEESRLKIALERIVGDIK